MTEKDNFDFLNFDIDSPDTVNSGAYNQANTPNLFPHQSQQPGFSFDNQFLDDLDNFGMVPGIGVIEEEDESNKLTPSLFDETNFIDLNIVKEEPSIHSNNNNHLAPNSYQSTNYATSYNNLQFGQGNNLSNIISPNEFSDFENSSYSSSFQHDSLRSPPMNSPAFSPSSLSSSIKNMTKEDKLRRRREFHNAVERRRRDLIKDRIKELGQLIPPSLLFEIQLNKEGKEIVKETRANKSIILNKTVDYILNLQNILENQDQRLAFLKSKLEELGG